MITYLRFERSDLYDPIIHKFCTDHFSVVYRMYYDLFKPEVAPCWKWGKAERMRTPLGTFLSAFGLSEPKSYNTWISPSELQSSRTSERLTM